MAAIYSRMRQYRNMCLVAVCMDTYLIEFIEFAHFEEDNCVPVHLLHCPILFLRLCEPHAWALAMLHMATSTENPQCDVPGCVLVTHLIAFCRHLEEYG